MKTILIGFVVSAWVLPVMGQTTISPTVPESPVYADSTGHYASTGVRPMGTGFYHRPGDPRNVMRATLDDMPVRIPSPLRRYTMLNPHLTGPYGNNTPYRYSMPMPDSLRGLRRSK